MSTTDFIITDAKIFTDEETNPLAEAVTIKGNRIVFVGTNQGRLSGGSGFVLTRPVCVETGRDYNHPSNIDNDGWIVFEEKENE
jgi:hypothetical protein